MAGRLHIALRKVPAGLVKLAVRLVLGYFAVCTMLLALYGLVDPPVTTVQVQLSIESLLSDRDFAFRRDQVRRDRMAKSLGHAVVAAEDGRFFQHPGVDFEAIEQAIEDNRSRRRVRGGSTITQQLVKNLFMTTHSTYARKVFEIPLALLADVMLSKERQLTLYLNNVEWGPGVFGAEAAARHHFDKAAADLSRSQSASLAALLPSPRRRTVGNSGWYRDIILQRMNQMGY